MQFPFFKIKQTTKQGRTGEIYTKHGIIETPAFVFCATKGALKSAWPHMAREANTQIILSNTYHLLVYPGSKKIEELGGLQKMLSWNGPMMTDSGGYQIFSLGYGCVSNELKGIRNTKKTLVKIKEEGARFKSYRDGCEIFLTPEGAMQAQIDFGADLIFVLDECTAFHIKKEKTQEAMERSIRWAMRCETYFEKYKKSHQGLYGIIQGGVYPDLREKSIDFINSLNCFGIGIGGSLGQNLTDMKNILELIHNKSDQNKPKHLLGIGTIDSILMAIPYGIDTFDCVYPTRLARHGGALIYDKQKRYLNLNNKQFESDLNPIQKDCNCCTCASFTRAYLHLLLKNDENLAIMALTQHNIAFMNKFMSLIRKAIKEDRWDSFVQEWTS